MKFSYISICAIASTAVSAADLEEVVSQFSTIVSTNTAAFSSWRDDYVEAYKSWATDYFADFALSEGEDSMENHYILSEMSQDAEAWRTHNYDDFYNQFNGIRNDSVSDADLATESYLTDSGAGDDYFDRYSIGQNTSSSGDAARETGYSNITRSTTSIRESLSRSTTGYLNSTVPTGEANITGKPASRTNHASSSRSVSSATSAFKNSSSGNSSKPGSSSSAGTSSNAPVFVAFALAGMSALLF